MSRTRSHCRGCGHHALSRVLDLGPGLAMDVCGACGLAQLAEGDAVACTSDGVAVSALEEQARDAVARVAASGWLTGETLREFGSPHGGSWLELLERFDVTPEAGQADIVLDCFGIMHEPDQRAAFAQRAAATSPGGVLLIQYHALAAILEQGQWNALRHGHFAYYSLPVLARLLADVGMRLVSAWDFTLYGGTTLVAAVHESEARHADSVIEHMRSAEQQLTDPGTLSSLQSVVDGEAVALRRHLERQRMAGRRVFGYGATSRAAALFARAGLDSGLVAAVADASPVVADRRMPGTDIAIVTPDVLVSAAPDEVVLMAPELAPELSERHPELAGRWVTAERIVAAPD